MCNLMSKKKFNDKTLNEVIPSVYISKIKELYLQNKPNDNLFLHE